MSRWCVTGGAGFFGIHMCSGLAALGEDVISYDIQTIPSHERPPSLTEVQADIRDSSALRAAFEGVDVVVHAAAALALAPPAEIEAVNALGTKAVLDAAAAAGVRRVVYIGSTAIYGMPKTHPIYENAPLDPMGDYGSAKSRAEQFCIETEGVETVRIRPKSFIGTGRLGIFQVLFDWIESGKRIYILGDGTNRFQLLDVRDLVDAVVAAADRGHNEAVYNIGASDFTTVNEDVGALLDHAASGSRIAHIPSRPAKAVLATLERLHLSPIYRWVYDTADQDSYVSIEKATAELDWHPRYSNQDALIDTYDWYLAEGKQLAMMTGTSHRVAWKQGALKILKAVVSAMEQTAEPFAVSDDSGAPDRRGAELPIELSIAAPAYNEAAGIEATVLAWCSYLENLDDVGRFEIVVCDDGSKDDTPRILERLADGNDRVRVVSHPTNRGAGAALSSAIAATSAPWVLLIDSDGQFPIENLRSMIDRLVEVGRPGVMGTREKKDGLGARLGSKLSGAACNAIYSTHYRDFNSALKLLDGDLIRSLPLEARGLNYSTEVTARLAEIGEILSEVPIRHDARQSGVSSMRFGRDALHRLAFVAYLALRRALRR